MSFLNTATFTEKSQRAYFSMVLLTILLALLPTVWMSLDLQAAALFAGSAPVLVSRHWWWVDWINGYVPDVFRGGLVLAFAVWVYASVSSRLQRWRLPLAFCVIGGIVGPGLVVNGLFKDHWQRARPYKVENFGGAAEFTRAGVMTDQCQENCSFVSGHVACGVFLMSLGLVHRRRQKTWALAGAAAGLLIGFSRMSASAHWLSDVLWAFPVTLVSSWLVWWVLNWLYAKPWRTWG
jgi:lipid A 4'-phosphatase